jgi:hypothetical protein
VWELAHQKPGQQKTADPNQEAAVKRGEIFCSADYSPLHIERHSPSSHRGISPSPVGSTGLTQCVPDVLMRTSKMGKQGNNFLCHSPSGYSSVFTSNRTSVRHAFLDPIWR